ncbi:MAG: Rieske 2Fe-2S domain-containing protein, partial [Stellaceae bacterium]
LLGEQFVAFRDTGGRVGVLDEFCMHRRASLALGRVEKNGIRCLYHGWKYGVDGTIQETPNHCDARFRQSRKAPAYPVREAGGLVWVYIGPADKEPPFQRYAFMDGPDDNRVALRFNVGANYLQLYEGGTDSSHVGILHSDCANPGWLTDTFAPPDEDYNPGALASSDNAPELELEATDYGYHYAARRQGPPRPDGTETHSVRVTPVIFPTGRIIPAPAFQFYVFEVPQNDDRTSTFLVCHGPKPVDRANILRILGVDDARFWSEKDCEFRASWDNDMNQNRTRMQENWTGFSGIEVEDAVVSVSMGAIVDRSKECLVAADQAVVFLRRRLLESVRRVEAGGDPIGVTIGDYRQVAALVDTVIDQGARWQDMTPSRLGVSAGRLETV